MKITITVDLTASFTKWCADAASADGEAADISSTTLYRPISAGTTTVWLPPQPSHRDRSSRYARQDRRRCHNRQHPVEDILTFVVSQPSNGASSDSETITNGVADPLTDKICRESGICNVKTQLTPSSSLKTARASFVDVVAILAFGRHSC
jgi:hypothetical protein